MRELPPDEWDGFLRERGLGDVYLARGYLRASAVLEEGSPVLLAHEQGRRGVAFPAIVRDVPGAPGLKDVISPYGYGGPVGFGDGATWPAFHAGYEAWCRARGVVSTFVRFHPLYANQRHAAPAMRVETLAGTVAWGIEGGRDLLDGMHKEHRRSVRSAEGAGLRVALGTPDADGLARFRRLYASTMARLGAAEFYLFPDRYWQTLLGELRDTLLLAEAVHPDEGVVASALFLASPPWLHYHLSASTDLGRRSGAATLVLLETARWAQARGFDVLHLGGGVGDRDDSLLRYKRRFDRAGLREAAIGKQIHDAAAYRRLAGACDTDGFFPRYRAAS